MEVREIPLGQTVVDSSVQRKFIPKHAQWLLENWDESKAGLLTVSARDDGTYHVSRGQHRRWAMLRQNRATAWAIVLYGLEARDEADNTLSETVARSLTSTDKFRLAVVADREPEVSISKLLKAHRLEPGADFFAYATLRSIARATNGMDVADDVLFTATQAWGRNKYAVHQNIVAGLGRLFLRREPDRQRLVSVLGKTTPDIFRASADAIVDRTRPKVQVPAAYAEQAVLLYNHALRGNRLASFL